MDYFQSFSSLVGRTCEREVADLFEVLDGLEVHEGDVVVVQIQRCQLAQSAHQVDAERAQVIVAQIQFRQTKMN